MTSLDHRRIVAAGCAQRNSRAIVTHKEGGGMEVVLSTMDAAGEVRLASMPRETMTQLIARARAVSDTTCRSAVDH